MIRLITTIAIDTSGPITLANFGFLSLFFSASIWAVFKNIIAAKPRPSKIIVHITEKVRI